MKKPQTQTTSAKTKRFKALFRAALAHFGPQYWWPGRTRFEIVVGAILTQNTAWTNVEKAIRNLKRHGLLSPASMQAVPRAQLAQLIRSSGYYNQKATKLLDFLEYFSQAHGDSFARMKKWKWQDLRSDLLEVRGIGPETADSILLYALDHPVFVIDAYTRRICHRHGFSASDASYDSLQRLFMQSLPHSTPLFNEYHALLVNVGKYYCKKGQPQCDQCPFRVDLS